jgi:hypothetical protein
MNSLAGIILALMGGVIGVSHAKSDATLSLDTQIIEVVPDSYEEDPQYYLLVTSPYPLDLKMRFGYDKETPRGEYRVHVGPFKLKQAIIDLPEECKEVNLTCYVLPDDAVLHRTPYMSIWGTRHAKVEMGIRKREGNSGSRIQKDTSQVQISMSNPFGFSFPSISLAVSSTPQPYVELTQRDRSINIWCSTSGYGVPHCTTPDYERLGTPQFHLKEESYPNAISYVAPYGYYTEDFVFIVEGTCDKKPVSDTLRVVLDFKDSDRVTRIFPKRYTEKKCDLEISGRFGDGYETDALRLSTSYESSQPSVEELVLQR